MDQNQDVPSRPGTPALEDGHLIGPDLSAVLNQSLIDSDGDWSASIAALDQAQNSSECFKPLDLTEHTTGTFQEAPVAQEGSSLMINDLPGGDTSAASLFGLGSPEWSFDDELSLLHILEDELKGTHTPPPNTNQVECVAHQYLLDFPLEPNTLDSVWTSVSTDGFSTSVDPTWASAPISSTLGHTGIGQVESYGESFDPFHELSLDHRQDSDVSGQPQSESTSLAPDYTHTNKVICQCGKSEGTEPNSRRLLPKPTISQVMDLTCSTGIEAPSSGMAEMGRSYVNSSRKRSLDASGSTQFSNVRFMEPSGPDNWSLRHGNGISQGKQLSSKRPKRGQSCLLCRSRKSKVLLHSFV